MNIRGMSPADSLRVGMLAYWAVDQLWYKSPDCLPEHEDYQGCCPYCCGPCSVIRELLEHGVLDEWVRGRDDLLPGTSWWDEANQQVDREWLARSWAKADEIGCHQPSDADAGVIVEQDRTPGVAQPATSPVQGTAY